MIAALSLHDIYFMGHQLKAQMGFTKFCKNFIKRKKCRNKKCMYAHNYDKKKLIIYKDD